MPLLQQIEALEKALPEAKNINQSISKKGVDWHIDHTLKVLNGVCKNLQQSNPEEYKWKFNKIRLLIFTKGSIPRGKGKAPKRVLPKDVITIEEIQQQIAEAKQLVVMITSLPEKSYFSHPLFGMLKRDKCIKFLGMHTHHHLTIINDIINT